MKLASLFATALMFPLAGIAGADPFTITVTDTGPGGNFSSPGGYPFGSNLFLNGTTSAGGGDDIINVNATANNFQFDINTIGSPVTYNSGTLIFDKTGGAGTTAHVFV